MEVSQLLKYTLEIKEQIFVSFLFVEIDVYTSAVEFTVLVFIPFMQLFIIQSKYL